MPRKSDRRAGFTLLEMLLVVGVLAFVMGLSVPVILRLHGQHNLTQSAEKVRGIASGARVRAIESGLVYQFRWEPNGTHFIVVPFERQFESDNLSAKGPGHTEGVGRFSRVSGQLPKGILFGASMVGTGSNPTVVTGNQQLSTTALDGLPNVGNLSSVSWSVPILFNPDGSANTDAELLVTDLRHQSIALRVRGFTGSISMGRLSTGKRP